MVTNEERIGYVIIGIGEGRNGTYQSIGVLLPKNLAERRGELRQKIDEELIALATEHVTQDGAYFAARAERVQPLARQIHEIDLGKRFERRELPKGRDINYTIGQILYM